MKLGCQDPLPSSEGGYTCWKNSKAQTCDCPQESQKGTGLLKVSEAERACCQPGKELGCAGGEDGLNVGTTPGTYCADL